MTRPRWIAVLAALVVLAVAVPVLAAPPVDKPKAEGAPITITGDVEETVDADGKTSYSLTLEGTTYQLHAGPKWFFETSPLAKYTGTTVTIVGTVATGTTDIDVETVDGIALRDAGKPPWAGGPKKLGHIHPGWSQEKEDRFKAKFGDCFPPGHCKDKTKPEKPENADGDEDTETETTETDEVETTATAEVETTATDEVETTETTESTESTVTTETETSSETTETATTP